MKVVNGRQHYEATESEMKTWLTQGYIVMTVIIQNCYMDIAVSRKAPSRYHELHSMLTGELK